MLNLFRKKKALEKELQEWKDKAECNARGLAILERENVELHECLKKIKKGERCEGVFCESCKHAIKGEVVKFPTTNNRVITIGNKMICALSVPCPDFNRKGE